MEAKRMKKAIWKRILSLSLGLLLLFSLSLTAAGAGMDDLAPGWTQDQIYSLVDPAPWNLTELKQAVDVHDPRSVAAYWVWALNRLTVNYDDGIEMMKYLFADLEPYGSGYTEGGLYGGWTGDFYRLTDSDYRWLPRTFFEGADPDNGFLLSQPLSIELYYNEPNTRDINDQSDEMGLGRSCIVYWIQSYAGGNQVNINLMKFEDSDRWYVTNGASSAAVFYDQRSALSSRQLKLAANTPADETTAAQHNAVYHSGVTDPVTEPDVPDGPDPDDPIEPTDDNPFKIVNTYREGQFSDVASTFWGAPNIAKAFELGLMKGVGDGFDPKGNVTLAQAITMAARIHSIYNTGSENFVQGTPWYQVYLDYELENHLLDEIYTDYNVPATRLQFAAILAYALPLAALEPINYVKDDGIPDLRIWNYHASSVYLLYEAGILTGSGEDHAFNPDANITRAEAAAIITRMADPSLRQSFTLD